VGYLQKPFNGEALVEFITAHVKDEKDTNKKWEIMGIKKILLQACVIAMVIFGILSSVIASRPNRPTRRSSFFIHPAAIPA